ncbi:hypothetical protein BJX99DRAFT_265062 [Aspergillus californicus]
MPSSASILPLAAPMTGQGPAEARIDAKLEEQCSSVERKDGIPINWKASRWILPAWEAYAVILFPHGDISDQFPTDHHIVGFIKKLAWHDDPNRSRTHVPSVITLKWCLYHLIQILIGRNLGLDRIYTRRLLAYIKGFLSQMHYDRRFNNVLFQARRSLMPIAYYHMHNFWINDKRQNGQFDLGDTLVVSIVLLYKEIASRLGNVTLASLALNIECLRWIDIKLRIHSTLPEHMQAIITVYMKNNLRALYGEKQTLVYYSLSSHGNGPSYVPRLLMDLACLSNQMLGASHDMALSQAFAREDRTIQFQMPNLPLWFTRFPLAEDSLRMHRVNLMIVRWTLDHIAVKSGSLIPGSYGEELVSRSSRMDLDGRFDNAFDPAVFMQHALHAISGNEDLHQDAVDDLEALEDFIASNRAYLYE